MPQFYRKTFLVALLAGGVVLGNISASAESGASLDWLWTRSSSAVKQAELEPNTPIRTTGYDCTPVSYRIGNKPSNPQYASCAYDLPFGSVTESGVFFGPEGPYSYRVNTWQTGLKPYQAGGRLFHPYIGSNDDYLSIIDMRSAPQIKLNAYYDGISTYWRYDIMSTSPFSEHLVSLE